MTRSTHSYLPGDELPNGALVLATEEHQPRRQGHYAHCTVLALQPRTHHPFASWLLVCPDDGEGEYCTAGEYSKTLGEAWALFLARTDSHSRKVGA